MLTSAALLKKFETDAQTSAVRLTEKIQDFFGLQSIPPSLMQCLLSIVECSTFALLLCKAAFHLAFKAIFMEKAKV